MSEPHYADTYKWTVHPNIANQTAYENDSPADYKVEPLQIPGESLAQRYRLSQMQNRQRHQQRARYHHPRGIFSAADRYQHYLAQNRNVTANGAT